MGQDSINNGDYLHNVEVHLALAAVNPHRHSLTRFAIHISPPSLPYKELRQGGSCYNTAKSLFKELTGSDCDAFFVVKLVGVYDQVKDGTIIILYAILIPDLVPLLDKSVEWVDFDRLNKHPTLLSMVGHACNYYKAGP